MLNNNFNHIIFGNIFNDCTKNLDINTLKSLLDENTIFKKCNSFSSIPIDDILIVLEKTGELIGDKNSKYFKKSMNLLPSTLSYSSEMIEDGLLMLKEILKRDNLKKRLSSIGDYHCLDTFTYESKEKIIRATPLGLLCHIGAGNVFLGAIDSLIHGIITKNINILKVSSQDFIFPTIFIEALIDADRNNIIIPYIAITYWDKDNTQVNDYIKNICDAILLFGGEDAVVNYKNGLSSKTKLFDFGPKLSFGLICKGLNESDVINSAINFAKDIIYWEQRACTSCQNIFIEDDKNTSIFINALHNALENLNSSYPQPRIELNSAIEIRTLKELEKWNCFHGNTTLLEGTNSNHTILVKNSNNLIDSPLNRTIYINKINDYKELFKGNINKFKYYMSTVAIASNRNIQNIIEDFISIGVMRFCKPGTMSSSDNPSQSHDGVYLPNLLIKYINTEDISIDSLGIDHIDTNNKNSILLSRLNDLLLTAKKSVFYKDFYKDVKLPLKNLEDFKNIPILEKFHLLNNSIEKSSAMLTSTANNCYTFSAGGTTGQMKYINYSCDEFQNAKKVFGQGFRAAGINSNDYVANYMKSGALWTGYIAVNDGLEETGCKILPITSNQDEEETIEYLKTFKPNAIMSIPGNLILLAQKVEEKNLDIQIEKIYYGGDHITENAKNYLKKIFKAKSISSMGYAAVETGPIGFVCNHCHDREHHVFEDWCYVERAENGDALVTVLKRNLHPIIRFRVGDEIEWVDEKCSCGRTSKKFKLLNRSDNTIRFNASDIYLNELEKIVSNFEDLSPFYQITIEPKDNMLNFNFNVELKENNLEIDKFKLENNLKHHIKNQCYALSKDKHNNLIKELNVKVLLPKELKRISRTNKLRKVIDKRISI